jgi:hypothetical protein
MVHFDFQRHEVNDAIVAKQGKLDAGPVFGLLNVDKISDSMLDAIRKSVVADSGYVDLGKRIVKSVTPVAERFINSQGALRTALAQLAAVVGFKVLVSRSHLRRLGHAMER